MKVAGNLFTPKDLNSEKNPAIIVGHPMGAVKDKARTCTRRSWPSRDSSLCHWICPSGAERGQPRNPVSPDIYAEDFSAAVDFLGTRPFVDRDRIAALGICGSGSFVMSAAKIDRG